MNLADDLTPTADPTPLLHAVRRRRHLRVAIRTALSSAAVIAIAIGLWPHPVVHSPALTTNAPTAPIPSIASISTPAAPLPSVKMTRDELIDALKDQTYALIRWPDGREQLLIRR